MTSSPIVAHVLVVVDYTILITTNASVCEKKQKYSVNTPCVECALGCLVTVNQSWPDCLPSKSNFKI